MNGDQDENPDVHWKLERGEGMTVDSLIQRLTDLSTAGHGTLQVVTNGCDCDALAGDPYLTDSAGLPYIGIGRGREDEA